MIAPDHPQTDHERALLGALRARADSRSPAYLLRNGSFQRPRVLTAAQTAYLASVRRKTRRKLQLCWDNARRAVLKHDPERRLQYCDGFAFALYEKAGDSGHALEHGWLLLDGEAAVDLTLSFTVAFYGVPFTREQVLDALDGRRSYGVGSLINDWQAGWPFLARERSRSSEK